MLAAHALGVHAGKAPWGSRWRTPVLAYFLKESPGAVPGRYEVFLPSVQVDMAVVQDQLLRRFGRGEVVQAGCMGRSGHVVVTMGSLQSFVRLLAFDGQVSCLVCASLLVRVCVCVCVAASPLVGCL